MFSYLNFVTPYIFFIAAVLFLCIGTACGITILFYQYKLYVFKEYLKCIYKVMRLRLRDKTAVLQSNVILDEEMANNDLFFAFITLFKEPYHFLDILTMTPYFTKISKNFNIKLSLPIYQYRYNDLEFFFANNEYNMLWLKPFKKAVQTIVTKKTQYLNKHINVSNLVSTTKIRLLIILNFLTWVLRKKIVILHRNNKK